MSHDSNGDCQFANPVDCTTQSVTRSAAHLPTQCLSSATHNRHTQTHTILHTEPPLGEGAVAFKMGHTKRMRCLEKAAIPHGRPGKYQPSLTEVEETKALLSLAPIIVIAVLFKVCVVCILFVCPLCQEPD